jgi:zinc resistance-associated protein
MKKTILILLAVAITGFSATQVLAGRTHHGSMDGNGMGTMQNMTGEQVKAQQAFMTDTADLRQNLAAKMGEYRALMAGDNPSPKEAGKLAGEIAGLKNQLREKAVAAGVPFKGHGMGMGMGMGMGNGPHKGQGKGQGNCNW